MLYRIMVQFPRNEEPAFTEQERQEKVLVGLTSIPELADFLEEITLRAPKKLRNPRATFYFTKIGYKLFGKRIATKAHELGYDLSLTGVRNIGRANIVYQDEFQMAILPIGKRSRRKSQRKNQRHAGQGNFSPEE